MIKSQSAMEYLMTYGWAVLIIALVLVTLFDLGAFNNPNIQTSCLAQTGFLCTNPIITNSGSVWVTLGYSGGPLNITGLGCSNSTVAPTNFQPTSLSLQPGQQQKVMFACPLSSGALGTKFTGTMWVQYSSNGQYGLEEQISSLSGGSDTGQNMYFIEGNAIYSYSTLTNTASPFISLSSLDSISAFNVSNSGYVYVLWGGSNIYYMSVYNPEGALVATKMLPGTPNFNLFTTPQIQISEDGDAYVEWFYSSNGQYGYTSYSPAGSIVANVLLPYTNDQEELYYYAYPCFYVSPSGSVYAPWLNYDENGQGSMIWGFYIFNPSGQLSANVVLPVGSGASGVNSFTIFGGSGFSVLPSGNIYYQYYGNSNNINMSEYTQTGVEVGTIQPGPPGGYAAYQIAPFASPNGNLYSLITSSSGIATVYIYTPDLSYVTNIPIAGDGPSSFNFAMQPNGNIYVAQQLIGYTTSVQGYTTSGDMTFNVLLPDPSYSYISLLGDFVAGPNGNIYVLWGGTQGNLQLNSYSPQGTVGANMVLPNSGGGYQSGFASILVAPNGDCYIPWTDSNSNSHITAISPSGAVISDYVTSNPISSLQFAPA